MAKKSSQPNAAGFIDVENKAVQPAEVKAPKKKVEKKETVEEVPAPAPAVEVAEVTEEAPSSEPIQ